MFLETFADTAYVSAIEFYNFEMTEWMINRIMNITSSGIKWISIIIILFNISICSTFNKRGMIYIGEWISGIKLVYPDLKIGQHGFVTRNCSFVNCFYTTDHFYFNDIKMYDILLFNAKGFCGGSIESPPNRSESQTFVFFGSEPAPSCSIYETKITFDLIWTYKLSSDIVRPFFIIKNKRNEVIGPRKYMHWDTNVEDMVPMDDKIWSKIKDKSIAAAFMPSRCDTETPQQQFVEKLEAELAKYGHRIDTYGTCGKLQCEMKHEIGKRLPKCSDLIQKDYYFYLAFEDALGEDYVTDNLLYALNNYAVPIVYGGANYSRFVFTFFPLMAVTRFVLMLIL